MTQPPAGAYWITAVLHQLGTDGVWRYYCIYTFPNQYTFSGSSPAPSADFTLAPTTPLVGQSVSFTDTSSGSPTSWSWSFGNGATSTARNPTYAYPAAGTYGVSLTATNAGGASTRTKSITVLAPTPPVITYFGANPSSVVTGQQSILTWTSTGGSSASIDQGIGAVPTSGSIAITPVIGVPYRLIVTGPGGSASATVTISAVPSTYAGTWILPSSARAPGQNAFWTTDLVVMNPTADTASVNVKFLGHEGRGPNGPERVYSIPPRSTRTWADVLGTMFGRETDWGPILVRSTASSLVAQGQTWTATPSGGSYGQSVAATSATDAIGASPRAIAGVRQDSAFRTNLVPANMKETDATVAVTLLLQDGTTATQQTVSLGPLGFLQLNVASNMGVANIVGGSFPIGCTSPGCQVAAYASVIDASTADPRTLPSKQLRAPPAHAIPRPPSQGGLAVSSSRVRPAAPSVAPSRHTQRESSAFWLRTTRNPTGGDVMTRRLRGVIPAGLLAFPLLASPRAAALPRSLTLDEVSTQGDTVLVGKVFSARIAWGEGRKMIGTEYTSELEEEWKAVAGRAAPPATPGGGRPRRLSRRGRLRLRHGERVQRPPAPGRGPRRRRRGPRRPPPGDVRGAPPERARLTGRLAPRSRDTAARPAALTCDGADKIIPR